VKVAASMENFERLLKAGLLYSFCLLNAIDFVQTLTFLERGIEGNLFVVYYPHLWFPLKLAFTFGLPIGLHRLDLYLTKKEEAGDRNGATTPFLRTLVGLTYFMVLVADVFFLTLVLRSMSILGRLA